MAITIVFGLLSSTFLVLILIPSLIFIGSEIKQLIFASKSWAEVKQRKQ
jgi:predicted RND superfamily exporter protein